MQLVNFAVIGNEHWILLLLPMLKAAETTRCTSSSGCLYGLNKQPDILNVCSKLRLGCSLTFAHGFQIGLNIGVNSCLQGTKTVVKTPKRFVFEFPNALYNGPFKL